MLLLCARRISKACLVPSQHRTIHKLTIIQTFVTMEEQKKQNGNSRVKPNCFASAEPNRLRGRISQIVFMRKRRHAGRVTTATGRHLSASQEEERADQPTRCHHIARASMSAADAAAPAIEHFPARTLRRRQYHRRRWLKSRATVTKLARSVCSFAHHPTSEVCLLNL